jgi:excisionase family DNA binding protein
MLAITKESRSKKAWSVKSAAEQFDASVPFVRNEIREGKLRAKKIGRKVVILDSDLQEYLETQPDWKPQNEKGEK